MGALKSSILQVRQPRLRGLCPLEVLPQGSSRAGAPASAVEAECPSEPSLGAAEWSDQVQEAGVQ